MNHHPNLKAYAAAYENLNKETLHSTLAPLLAKDIYFEDPFNRLYGKDDTLRLFEHMFATLQAPSFSVLDFAQGEKGHGFIYWQFEFHYKGLTEQFDGMSKVQFNLDGEVCSHIDFWDPAKHLYSRIPLLGWAIGKVQKRIALPADWHKTPN